MRRKLGQIGSAQFRHWLVACAMWALAFWLGHSLTDAIVQDVAAQRSFGALMAQIGAGLLGVCITVVALVFALPDRPFTAAIRESGHFLDLCASLASVAFSLALVAVFGCAVALLDSPGLWLSVLIALPVPLIYLGFLACLKLWLVLVWVAWGHHP